MVRILVVDDLPDIAHTFVIIFTLSGFEARPLTDGTKTLSVVTEFKPHVVFLDLVMPNCDGADIARDLLALPDPPKVFIISANVERQPELKQIGVDGFLVKPANPNDIIALVRTLPA